MKPLSVDSPWTSRNNNYSKSNWQKNCLQKGLISFQVTDTPTGLEVEFETEDTSKSQTTQAGNTSEILCKVTQHSEILSNTTQVDNSSEISEQMNQAGDTSDISNQVRCDMTSCVNWKWEEVRASLDYSRSRTRSMRFALTGLKTLIFKKKGCLKKSGRFRGSNLK